MSFINKFHRRLLLVGTLLLIMAPGQVFSAAASELVISPEIQLRLAGMFLAEGENYRAVTEYKKFLHLFPDSPYRDRAMFKMAKAYMHGEDYTAAISVFRRLRSTTPDSKYVAESHYLEGVCYWQAGDTTNAVRELGLLIETSDDLPVVQTAIKARALIAFDKGEIGRSINQLSGLLTRFSQDQESEKVRGALSLIDDYQRKSRKSPGLAASLSAVLPGSGYFYAGRPGDGLSAFVINALFVAGLVEAIDQENDGMAVLAGGFGLPFYVGNIYGSANAARKWNLSVQKKSSEQIYISLGFNF
jgi:outer membrane protein assembly factor BamD (BamD/ComL family)/TM2 domain-containing membrane protein YozV